MSAGEKLLFKLKSGSSVIKEDSTSLLTRTLAGEKTMTSPFDGLCLTDGRRVRCCCPLDTAIFLRVRRALGKATSRAWRGQSSLEDERRRKSISPFRYCGSQLRMNSEVVTSLCTRWDTLAMSRRCVIPGAIGQQRALSSIPLMSMPRNWWNFP